MRAVIQRVLRSAVTVDGVVVGAVERGLCVLVGITNDDTEAEAEYLCRKVRPWDSQLPAVICPSTRPACRSPRSQGGR